MMREEPEESCRYPYTPEELAEAGQALHDELRQTFARMRWQVELSRRLRREVRAERRQMRLEIGWARTLLGLDEPPAGS